MTTITKCEGSFVETEVDGELVLMNTATGNFYSLEDSGLAIWRTIDGNRGRADIVNTLAREFDETPEAIAADVDAFLASLADAGLIEEKAAP
ncbi:PqqD family protein [Croceicoccus bisphenolivorans]|uniref:PqqD family protein n=1 Tax=Croceicoccus bisphenolivorans TaxID=1783232 RepID=UPI000832B606|nr:PqqD family protein [Croceicoccus bisphenolivorans]